MQRFLGRTFAKDPSVKELSFQGVRSSFTRSRLLLPMLLLLFAGVSLPAIVCVSNPKP